ncbi:unnamed protein product [Adineta steineri]|uniref:F-box domain-containing protein n=1 Tax=Adineta steineri TaxID=433720 RepID=A0A815QR05_9BILA|nr:unnamed protein product [Adineta steineri]
MNLIKKCFKKPKIKENLSRHSPPEVTSQHSQSTDERRNLPTRSPPKITWQHSWSTDGTKNGLENSHFQIIPTEVILHIFKYLSVHDLGNVSSTCPSFKMITDQDEVWKLKCNSSTKLHSKSYKEIYIDWMYEKYLRNIELEEVKANLRKERSNISCGMHWNRCDYFVRPEDKHPFESIGGIRKHPHESKDMTIDLSVDVDKTAHELISLLQKASYFQPQWRQSSIIKQMMTRYYRFMQLKASSPNNILLIPTLDIEIIWQTHLLRPQKYRDDCMRLFHRIIDHSLLANEIEQFLKEQAFIDTCKLYEERFGEQYCPLPEQNDNEPVAAKYVYSAFGSLKCVIPIYSYWDETNFDFSSVSSIDIIWHSHMQEPLKYASDCIRLVGYIIDHAPWPSVDTNKMKRSCDDTMNALKMKSDNDMRADHLYNTKGFRL